MTDDGDSLGIGRTQYLDFELEIGPGSGQAYTVSVMRSPAGEARETMVFPFDKLALEHYLKDMQIELLRSGGTRRQILSPEEETVQTFGRALFDALISGETRSRYDLSSREARQQGKGLRLKLRVQPPELAVLPWEFLYDPRQAEYVCLSRNTPIVRYLELPHAIQPLAVSPPLRILGMIASPLDTSLPSLDIGREKRRIERAVQALQSEGLVNLTWLEGQTWRDLQRAMRGGPWHIFHFIGHGGFDPNSDEGLVALADEEGMTHSFRATELGRLLADHRSLRLVLLNSCEGARASERDIFSSTASILVRRGLPAVLAMQYEISDQAAIEFARAFYEALADGLPVDAAVTEARKAVSLAVTNSVEWGIPVLYMRAPQGVIFQLPEMGRVRQRQASPPAFLDKEQEARLEQLYTDGLSAFWVEDWDRACRSFQAILDEYPGYPNAAAKLEEARRLRTLNTWYSEAREAEAAGNWAVALSALERLVSESPDFKDAAALLETARQQKQLADLYQEVGRLYQAEQWQAVVNVFAQIHALDPGYGDPDDLLAGARREVAALKRQTELEQLYRQAVVEMDAGHWSEAGRLLARVEEDEPGYREAGRLLERAETELAREEAARQREAHLTSLYEQALGLTRAGQWRQALTKLEEIQALDPHYPDPEGIAARAQEEVAREEAEAQRQSELAALYAEAVRLLKAEQYQAALEKLGEVQARDADYPDRQKVGTTARKKLNDLAREGTPRRQLPRWMMAALGLLGLVLIVAIGALLISGGTTASLTDTSQPCQSASEFVEIETPWLVNEVTIDGKITTAEEWSDAVCLNAALNKILWRGDDGTRYGDKISSKWWIKNDAQRLYILARIPAAEFEARGASVNFFAGGYEPDVGWEFSDSGKVDQDGNVHDEYGWDEETWHDDLAASPPGGLNVQGAASQDETYYWFEFAKDLDSGEGYDWAWAGGETVGDGEDEVIELGVWAEDPVYWFDIDVVMHLAAGQSPTAARDQLPSPVSEALLNPKVLFHDDFDQLSSSEWDFDREYVKASDGLVEITSTPLWPRLERAGGSWLNEGEGVLILFKYDVGAGSVFNLGSGEWATPSWIEWDMGIDDDGVHSWFTLGSSDVEEGPLVENLNSDPNTWYYILLAVGEEGEIVAKVWDRDNPSRMAEYRRTFGEDWAGRDWEFFIEAANNGKMYVDSFTHIAFSELR